MSESTPLLKAPESQSRDSHDQTILLPDGRYLGYAIYGSDQEIDVPTVLYFHGVPGSRLEAAQWDVAAKNLNVRVVGIDRPGIGLSSSLSEDSRELLDWSEDVREFAHRLDLKKYYIMGASGGGPYALACAHALPTEDILGVGVVAGMGPWKLGTKGMRLIHRILINVMVYLPWIARMFLDASIVAAVRNPNQEILTDLTRQSLGDLSPLERAVIENNNEELLHILVAMLKEAYRRGSTEILDDMRVLTSSWGFELDEVDYEGVRFWYGTEDTNAPLEIGQYMVERLPKATLSQFRGDTHLTIVYNHAEEILSDLLQKG